MKNAYKPVWVLLLLLLAVAAISTIFNKPHGDSKIPWGTSGAAAIDDAKSAGKPALLYFTASWCGVCQRMKRSTWSDAQVEAKLHDYVTINIDVDADEATARRFGVEGLPTFVVLDAQGEPVKRASGFMSAEEFLNWIRA
jgi:thiol:disulfide interchange protein